MPQSNSQHRVAIIGGGLAGLSAAAALCGHGLQVEIFEARKQLGGRAGSFYDSTTDEWVDHCQHVGMGCCTNLDDFLRNTGVDRFFKRHEILHFFGPDGRQFDMQRSTWLPAPFHLAPSFLRLGYLTLRERLGIARAMLKLARTPIGDDERGQTIGDWLSEQNQSERAIERFWSVVLVSALGESIERASLAAARKVFVDGFMAHHQAYQINVPTVPLSQLYERIARELNDRGVTIHLGKSVKQILARESAIRGLALDSGDIESIDFCLAAVPWRRLTDLVPRDVGLNEILESMSKIKSSSITAVHLWFDRSITTLPHAVLVDRLSQWVFHREENCSKVGGSTNTHYYQVVISASRELSNRDRKDVLQEVLNDLYSVWPESRDARLTHWRIVTQHDAVFSVVPGLDRLRPSQRTPIHNLMLAGDWTRTGWPSTLEGAVRSGRLAAAAILGELGTKTDLLVEDLPKNWLARWLLKPAKK